MSTQPKGLINHFEDKAKYRVSKHDTVFTLNSHTLIFYTYKYKISVLLTCAFCLNMLSSFHLYLNRCTSLFSFDKPWNSVFAYFKQTCGSLTIFAAYTYKMFIFYMLWVTNTGSIFYFIPWNILFRDVMGVYPIYVGQIEKKKHIWNYMLQLYAENFTIQLVICNKLYFTACLDISLLL